MLGYLPEKNIRGSFSVLEERVLFLCKMSPKTRPRNKKAVNESDKDTTVAKKAGQYITVVNEAGADETARSGKGAAELTQSSGFEEMSSTNAYTR